MRTVSEGRCDQEVGGRSGRAHLEGRSASKQNSAARRAPCQVPVPHSPPPGQTPNNTTHTVIPSAMLHTPQACSMQPRPRPSSQHLRPRAHSSSALSLHGRPTTRRSTDSSTLHKHAPFNFDWPRRAHGPAC
jgi:hypothetical protein